MSLRDRHETQAVDNSSDLLFAPGPGLVSGMPRGSSLGLKIDPGNCGRSSWVLVPPTTPGPELKLTPKRYVKHSAFWPGWAGRPDGTGATCCS